MKLLLTGLLLCGMAFAALSDESKAAVPWPGQWANDSIAHGSGESLEIHRDVSDLWFAAQSFQIPGLFLELCRLHAFLLLTQGIEDDGPGFPQKMKVVRLTLRFRKSKAGALEEAVRIRLKRKTMRSTRFRALTKVAHEDPGRFAGNCREAVDSYWQNDLLKSE